jgi:hypothetical protein
MNIDATTEGGKILAEAFRPKYKVYNEYLKTDLLEAHPMRDLMPIPKELEITASPGTKDEELKKLYEANKAKYGAESWYDWCIGNWGTKWDARVEDFNDDDPKDVYIYFETAWSPPTAFLEWFCSQHPDTIFNCEYDEEGMFFEGETSHHPDAGFQDNSWEPVQDEEEIDD